jgi:protein-tyrosine phosphatase
MDAVPSPGTLIEIASVPNFRDVGGYATADGRTVRSGVLFRSTALAFLSDDDVPTLDALGLRTVFDLRTDAERAARPDRLPDGATLVVCDVMAGREDVTPAQLAALLDDPTKAKELIGGGKSEEFMRAAYRQIVGSQVAHDAYRHLFTSLLDDGVPPALFHCTTGKDRTGWAAAATLLLLGVSGDDVMEDYLLTNRYLLPALKFVFDRFETAGGEPELLRPILGVDETYLQTALTELAAEFGTIEAYFADGLGIDAAAQAELRARLTT